MFGPIHRYEAATFFGRPPSLPLARTAATLATERACPPALPNCAANGIDYGWIKRKTPGYPTAEEMYVMAPATAREKQLKSFEQEWDEHATGGMPLFAGLYCGADDFVAQACDEDVA